MIYDVFVNNMLKHFIWYISQRDWSVICGNTFVTFLKEYQDRNPDENYRELKNQIKRSMDK